MSSIFSKIIAGDIPGEFVYQDELCAAFLDISPLSEGHTLVVPREEIDEWTDLPDDLAAHLFQVAGRVGKAQKQAFDCVRIGLLIQGYEVPHVHIHVWPTKSLKEFDVVSKRTVGHTDELAASAAALRAALGTDEQGFPVATA